MCGQWRRLGKMKDKDLPEMWTCDLNPDEKYARCEVAQELPDDDIDRLLGLLPPKPKASKVHQTQSHSEEMTQQDVVDLVVREFERVLQSHRERDAKWYNDGAVPSSMCPDPHRACQACCPACR